MLDPDILGFYGLGLERDRLADPRRSIEFLRTMDILQRHLPAPPARLLDVGGGPGRYALALTALGYSVDLVDPVPLHLEQARAAAAQYGQPLRSIAVGDARRLDHDDGSYDAVLMLGPLYHLTAAADRHQAWAQARRVLRPGGIVAAAGASRFYTTWQMLTAGTLNQPGAEDLLGEHLTTGQHRNRDHDARDHDADPERMWTTAYLHTPEELSAEATAAGLRLVAVLAIEGPAKLLHDLAERMQNKARRGQVMRALLRLEREPSVLGASQHILALAAAPAG